MIEQPTFLEDIANVALPPPQPPPKMNYLSFCILLPLIPFPSTLMELCTCKSCSLRTCQQPDGPVPGQFISSRNKKKHQHNDLINSQDTLTFSPHQMSFYPSTPSSENSTNDTSTDSTCETESRLHSETSLPGSHSPNIITISNCMKLLVDELLVLKDGFEAFTAQNPLGQKIYLQILPICGDLLATHKAVGFGSPAASQFCGWCQASLNKLNLMNIGVKRTGIDVLDSAKAWLASKALKEQEEICKRTGVRWSELNRLPYRIPNMHVALDEGQEKKRVIRQTNRPRKRMRTNQNKAQCDEEEEIYDSGSDNKSGSDLQIGEGVGGGFMTSKDIHIFRDLMDMVVIPSGPSQLPSNLGCANHGQLKASQWLTLFTLIIPLVITELYIESKAKIDLNSIRGKFLQNIGDLVQRTRIVGTRAICDGDAGSFFYADNRFTISSKETFNNPHFKPNHHYVLHIPEQLKLWGPPFGVAGFAGERMIGILQKMIQFKAEIHGTLLKKGIEAQRLLGGYPKVSEIIEEEEDPMNGKGILIQVGEEVYNAMVETIKRNGGEVKRFENFPHPQGSRILSQFTRCIQSLTFGDEKAKVGSLPPNNLFIYKAQGTFQYGFVKSIYIFQGKQKEHLPGIYLTNITNQYTRQKYPPGHIGYHLNLLGSTVGKISVEDAIIIRTCDIFSFAAYRPFENDIFCASSNGVIFCPSNRQLYF
ncbi:hypothetical protein O181_052161 [Austropuccinia psidii MF-1]|uniref:Uncharacterized protein n=1 Tax=Austropuccinia psidii MF-1 TaxID=1389203 RepID=A0A9Q3DXT6_9BASI|nr:hypothetical protein [Austropuccinia psidii MF-1]